MELTELCTKLKFEHLPAQLDSLCEQADISAAGPAACKFTCRFLKKSITGSPLVR